MSIATFFFFFGQVILVYFELSYKTGYCYFKAETGSMLNKPDIIWVQ